MSFPGYSSRILLVIAALIALAPSTRFGSGQRRYDDSQHRHIGNTGGTNTTGNTNAGSGPGW